MHNDVFAGAQIKNSVVRRNLGNGVSTRGSFFQVFNCTLADNTAAGFEYNPSYTTYEALQVCGRVIFQCVCSHFSTNPQPLPKKTHILPQVNRPPGHFPAKKN